MNRLFLPVFLALLFVAFSDYSDREFVDFSDKGTSFEVEVSDGKYVFQYYSSEILEVHFVPDGEKLVDSSYAVVMELSDENIATATESDQAINIDSDGIDVIIRKNPFQVQFSRDGSPIIAEKSGYVLDSLETIEFSITGEEALYGAGSRALGMDRRGYRLPLYNRAQYGYSNYSEQLNYSIPIVLSSNQYLLHFDNAPIGFLDLDSQGNNTIKYETISGRKTYQLVVGDDWLDIMDNYTQLTGRHAMLPRWALGNFSSRFGYRTQEEVLETVSKFKEDEIPVDAVIIDLFWFGKEIQYTLGNFEFDTDSFPDPDRMIRELRDQDVETILITEPFVLKTSKRWEEALEKEVLAVDSTGHAATFEFYFGDGGIIDVYDEKGYNWFSDINRGLLERGVTGIWGDLGEPEAHPSYVIHASGTADEVHNTYGHDWARLVYNTFSEYNPEMRPFILMRAGAAGSQRFGLIPWSGDVSRSWEGFNRQIEIAMQMGMQGLTYMHSDLGGFTPGDRDPELYTRWMQYGVFQPIYRPHAVEPLPSEPVFWDDTTKALAKTAIELRYQLLPYNYSLAWDNTQTGAPLMRPLFFVEPENSDLYDYDATYLWGDDFLISPVMEPGISTQDVYLPTGSTWIDFYSGEQFNGGQSITVDLFEEYIPTFVRAGSIIPMAKPMQTTKEYDGSEIELHYYYADGVADESFTLYNDDGLTKGAFENGAYELLEFSATPSSEAVNFSFSANTGTNYSSSTKRVDLVIRSLNAEPVQLLVDDQQVEFTFDEQSGTVRATIIWDTASNISVQVQF